MQKKIGGKFNFFRKKGDFSNVFSAFYGQRSVTAAWATRSPWSIPQLFSANSVKNDVTMQSNLETDDVW